MKKEPYFRLKIFLYFIKNFPFFYQITIDITVTVFYNIIKGGEQVGKKKKNKSQREKELKIALVTAIINLIISLIELINKLLDTK
jgi:hypothetical protein